jgi:hypothetical protein
VQQENRKYILNMMTVPIHIQYLSIANMIASLGLVGYLAYHHPSSTEAIPQNASTSTKVPLQSTSPTKTPSYAQVFHDLEEPLQDIAIQKGINPSSLLPSNEELKAAIESNDIHSKVSQKVLDIYKASYELHEIPYPALNQREQEEEDQTDKNSGEQIITAYFQGQLMRLARASKKQNANIDELLPTNEEIQQAATSRDISSTESQKAIQKIQRAYKELDIPFHPPTAQ